MFLFRIYLDTDPRGAPLRVYRRPSAVTGYIKANAVANHALGKRLIITALDPRTEEITEYTPYDWLKHGFDRHYAAVMKVHATYQHYQRRLAAAPVRDGS